MLLTQDVKCLCTIKPCVGKKEEKNPTHLDYFIQLQLLNKGDYLVNIYLYILRHEETIAMIIELNHGIPGFDNDEIKAILYYISPI